MKNSESGRSRGFGFVTFSDPNNVGLVLDNGPHMLDGRTVCTIFIYLYSLITLSSFLLLLLINLLVFVDTD